jgi:hypothetical protein
MPNNFLFPKRFLRGVVSDELVVVFAFAVTLVAFVGAFVFFVKSYRTSYQHEAHVKVVDAQGLLVGNKLYRVDMTLSGINNVAEAKRVHISVGAVDGFSVDCGVEDFTRLDTSDARVCVSAYSFKSAEFIYSGVKYKFYVYIDESGVLNINVYSDGSRSVYRGLEPCSQGSTVLCLVDAMLSGRVEYSYALAKPIVVVSGDKNGLHLTILLRPINIDGVTSIVVGLEYAGNYYSFELYPSEVVDDRVVFAVK